MKNEIVLDEKILVRVQQTLNDSKEHLQFLAKFSPEIRDNLESISQTMECVIDILEQNRIFSNTH